MKALEPLRCFPHARFVLFFQCDLLIKSGLSDAFVDFGKIFGVGIFLLRFLYLCVQELLMQVVFEPLFVKPLQLCQQNANAGAKIFVELFDGQDKFT